MKKVYLATLGLTVATASATATVSEAANWRCVDDPDLPDCEEALINEIEDMVDANWPSSLLVPLNSLPYRCTGTGNGGGTPNASTEATASATQIGRISLFNIWRGDLRAFIIGRYNVTADVLADVQVAGDGVAETIWPGTAINYLFQDSGTEVMAPGGSTGVADIGGFLSFLTGGAFWSGTLQITMDWLPDGYWTCVVGDPGRTVQKSGTNYVRLNYPISWTHPQHFLDEAIRNQFRSAVRFLVTGAP